MNCPKCGAVLAPGAKFCVTCGTPCNTQNAMNPQYQAPQQVQYAQPQQQYAQQPQQAAAKKPASKFDFKQVLAQLSLIFKPLWTKIKPIATDKKKLSIIVGGFALLVVLAIVCGILTSGNGFIQVKQAIDYHKTDSDEYTIVVNNKALKTTISTEKGIENFETSIDGKAAALLTNDGELYGISGKKVVKLADDVTSFVLSTSGKGVAYVVKDEDESTLYVSKINNAKGTEISDSVGGGYAISPDGKSVAYYEVSVEDTEYTKELKLFKGKKSVKLTDDSGATLLGLSNGGKQIYVAITGEDAKETNLYSYNQKGDRRKIGSMGDTSVVFNADHTQVMFIDDENKMYISTKGKDAKKASSDPMVLLIPKGSTVVGNTYPVEDLYNHVYSTGDKVVVLKKNSDKNIKLVSNTSGVRLDVSAEYLYYYKNGELRVSKISDGERAGDKYKVLVDDTISGFYISSNRKTLYYTDSHGTLYSCNGKKRSLPREVAEDVTKVAMSSNDILYYVSDGDLYASKNGKKGSKVLSDCTSLYSEDCGVIYAKVDDTLYCSTGSKKPKKVLNLD